MTGRGRHGNHARGKANGNWKGSDELHSSHGYTRIRVGVGHPLADPKGYAYAHLVVWVSAGRPKPQEGEMLHHCNGDKTDNRLENLELISRSEHHKRHVRLPNGRFGSGLRVLP